jgi:hypothetical protein
MLGSHTAFDTKYRYKVLKGDVGLWVVKAIANCSCIHGV